MTLTIELPLTVEAQLRASATLNGQPLEEYVREILERESQNASSRKHNPLAAALALSHELEPIIKAGTRGPLDAAADLKMLREERLNDLSH